VETVAVDVDTCVVPTFVVIVEVLVTVVDAVIVVVDTEVTTTVELDVDVTTVLLGYSTHEQKVLAVSAARDSSVDKTLFDDFVVVIDVDVVVLGVRMLEAD